ncbi:MAG: hypothetical protein E4G99_09325, partial [Anaerolineales bacterium]
MKRSVGIGAVIFILVFMTACSRLSGFDSPAPTDTVRAPTRAPAVASDTPEMPRQLVFIDRLEGWEAVKSDFVAALEQLTADQGWEFLAYQAIPDEAIWIQASLIVVLGGGVELTSMIEANPQASFLLVAVPGSTPGERVAVIGPEGMGADQAAFLSGYISALTTANWRVGMIAMGDTGEVQAALAGFLNGAVYFCGLCRPGYPPFHAYPTTAFVQGSDSSDLDNGLQQLAALGVSTIGLTAEFSSEAVDLIVGSANNDRTVWIGPNPPLEAHRATWIATVRPDPASALLQVWESLLQGEADILMPM